MWSKLSNALKRPSTPGLSDFDDESHAPQVLAGVYEQHPNMSVFHQQQQEPQSSEVPFPSPSPPPSPSRSFGRRGLLKRMSKMPFNDSEVIASSPKTIGLPKKVKSSLQSISTGSDISLIRQSTESRPSQETTRPSLESQHPPMTPITESKFGSLRSILKPNNTPGTGQSVRFFSRDAYRVISPEQSSSELEDPSTIMTRLKRNSPPARPTAQQVFSPPGQEPMTPISPASTSSLMMPIPPPDLTNIFDLSEEKELPTIPMNRPPLMDSAVEISETEDAISSPVYTLEGNETPERASTPIRENPPSRTSVHDRSHSFSFGQTVFHSLASNQDNSRSPTPDGFSKGSISKANRNRALSDTVFHTMIHSPITALQDARRPEMDINDTSNNMIVMGSPEKEKDPFAAHATTYYTPGTMLPPSPPASTHTRKASREEDMIWSLRTQLALQSELCAQFEVDLSARDEMVDHLNHRLQESDKELERRKNIIKGWRKKVVELQKCIRGLEEEVDRSREESVERSVMDEASGEALRMLHRRIGELEREKEKDAEVRRELEKKADELEKVKEELKSRDQSERELKDGIRAAKEEMELMGQRQSGVQTEEQQEELKALLAKSAQTSEAHQAAAASWDEERGRLVSEADNLRQENIQLQSQITDAREEIVHKEEEMRVLRNELEAQWKNTEKMSEEMEGLRRERNELADEVQTLNQKIETMELEWTENENKKMELENEVQNAWNAKDELENQREELEAQLLEMQEHSNELTRGLQEREDRIKVLTQEHQYDQDSLSRLQEHIRQRDNELADYQRRIMDQENEVENLREEMTKAKREHSRTVDEQSRKLSEVVAREVEARVNMENMVRSTAQNDVVKKTLQDRVDQLTEEVEKLRRQVHDLQMESADKEVKLAQAAKQRAKDKEDLQGLNIALDSKQQELELLKRRVAARTSTSNNTPTVTKTASHRRESSIFGTPGVVRPPSAMSDSSTGGREKRLSDPPSAVGKTTLVRSARMNAATTSAAKKSVEGSMGPPPLKRAGSLLSSSSTATPTRIPSGSGPASLLNRSSSVTPTAKTAGRRLSINTETSRLRSSIASRESLKSSTSNLSSSTISEVDEKENIEAAKSSKPIRRNPVPA